MAAKVTLEDCAWTFRLDMTKKDNIRMLIIRNVRIFFMNSRCNSSMNANFAENARVSAKRNSKISTLHKLDERQKEKLQAHYRCYTNAMRVKKLSFYEGKWDFYICLRSNLL